MNKFKKLDEKNTYIPNLNNIHESSIRQFMEGCFFLEMATNITNEYYNITNKDLIYDLSNSIASTLAFACESFLKALYIFENNIKGNDINSLWEKLRKPEKIDSKRDKKKVKGHDLDILIDNLSSDTKTLLETRMLTINSENTGKYEEVTIYDILLKNNKIKKVNFLDENKYHSWLEHHKRTFEKSRYGGQLYHKVNLEFLFHLATQICAVAQYKICPTEKQKKFNKFEHIEELPNEVITLFHLENDSVDEKLINLISKNNEKREEFIKIMHNKTLLDFLINKSDIQFYDLINYFNYDELEIIMNYLNAYNALYDSKEKEIHEKEAQRGFICLNELEDIDYIYIFKFFLICCMAKKEYKIKITEKSLKDLTNIYLEKEVNTNDENILKLAKKINS